MRIQISTISLSIKLFEFQDFLKKRNAFFKKSFGEYDNKYLLRLMHKEMKQIYTLFYLCYPDYGIFLATCISFL